MSSLIIETSSPFTIVRFEAPNIRNSFGSQQAEELLAILQTKPKALLLYSGVPNVFCSGGNLKDYAKKTKSESIKTNKIIREALAQLSMAAIPTILVVDGDVLGGGIELLSCFDHVFASPKSLFGFWQRKIALSYGWSGGERLLRRLSPHALKLKSISTELFDSYEAKKIGLVDDIIPSHLLLDSGVRWTLKQLHLPQESFSVLKNFSVKTETKDFEKIWGNTFHKEFLDHFIKRSVK